MNEEVLFKREQLAKNICAQLNNFVDLRNTLSTIIEQIQEVTKVEAINIRLFEEGDYPFFVSKGFHESFIRTENSIISNTVLLQDQGKNGKYKLDCLCGQVIRGNVDALKDYYTEKGSYWTNNSTDLTPTLQQEEKDINIRNHCNACGYESIGLFPIKTRDENIGLLQLNDKRTGFFTADLIEFMEMIGEQIGVAVENAMLYDKLKNKNIELESSLHELSALQEQLMEAKKMTALADMVSGIAHEIYNPITQAYSSASLALEIAYDLAEKDTGYSAEINMLSNENKKALKNLREVQDLIRSFKAIAIDQFQESRQLINLQFFIADIIKVIKPSLKEINIRFITHCEKKIEFMSYSGVLSQVLSQFIQNSYYHGFKGKKDGEISINCNISHNDFIEIIYSDNGKGLDQGIKHKIFEPFFTTDRKNHAGLGLSIAENLVKNKLKGTIEVSTSLDEGVEFSIRIPF
jgi:signal transduction histidine kinase